MSITTPKSGDVITKSSITGMHENLRTDINAMTASFIGPSSFGHHQVSSSASPLVAFDSVNDDGTSTIVVTTNGTSDQPSDVTNWQELTAFRLDNGGSTFITTTDSTYVVYFTCRITVARDGASNDLGPSPQCHSIFGITYEDNLGTETVLDTSVMAYAFYGINPMTTVFKKQEIPVAIWCSFSFAGSKIIDKIRFYGAKLNGTGVTTPTDFIVERGTSGCLVFERV